MAGAANDLAAVLRKNGWAAESEELHREALALRRASGNGTLPVAERLNNLAGMHLDRGENREARELLTEALSIPRAILGEGDPLTSQSLSNLATAALGTGEQDEAQTLLLAAELGLRAAREAGWSGPCSVLTNLATIDLRSGELDLAEGCLLEALEFRLAGLGPDHPDVASTRNTLALVQHALGRDDEAAENREHVLRIRRVAFASSGCTLARCRNTVPSSTTWVSWSGPRSCSRKPSSPRVGSRAMRRFRRARS